MGDRVENLIIHVSSRRMAKQLFRLPSKQLVLEGKGVHVIHEHEVNIIGTLYRELKRQYMSTDDMIVYEIRIFIIEAGQQEHINVDVFYNTEKNGIRISTQTVSEGGKIAYTALQYSR
jgi:hypothetical protein